MTFHIFLQHYISYMTKERLQREEQYHSENYLQNEWFLC